MVDNCSAKITFLLSVLIIESADIILKIRIAIPGVIKTVLSYNQQLVCGVNDLVEPALQKKIFIPKSLRRIVIVEHNAARQFSVRNISPCLCLPDGAVVVFVYVVDFA